MSGRDDAGMYAAYQAAMQEQANQSVLPDPDDIAAGQSIQPDASDAGANESIIADRDDILAVQEEADKSILHDPHDIAAGQSIQPDPQSVMPDPDDILAGAMANQNAGAAVNEILFVDPGGLAPLVSTLSDDALDKLIEAIRDRASVPESNPEREADLKRLEVLEGERAVRDLRDLGVVDEPGWEEWLDGILDGHNVLHGIAEVVEVFEVAGRIGRAAELYSVIGSVVEIGEIGWHILEAFETGEKIAYAQGVCYGIMYQTLGMPDREIHFPKDWP